MNIRDAKVLRNASLETPTDLGSNAVRNISGALNVLLADMFALYVKTKNFHWHMSGPHFRDYHLLLDEQATQLFATIDDIAERFAGLRVLPAATQAAFDRSRETVFTTDRDVRPRVLCIYGGKLTGWRAAAAHVMQRISPSLPAAERRAETDLLILRRPT